MATITSQHSTAITPTRLENYSEWYQQVIKHADLAEISPVRGCMIIKPWGYAIWENIQRILDEQIKATGHKNAYFPLLIPVSYLEKEAQHIEGFAKECAVVTHSRLVKNEAGKLMPAGALEDAYIIRPTSETIIGDAFSRWIQSYRDLPLLINQWANVMRWEMRTRLFLRTSEFLWQEGHTAHATKEEAQIETRKMLDLYESFAQDVMAMPVVKGEKTENERFPGAINTYTIEALMQDGKALQAGTSHFLGQNFSNAFNIKFLDAQGKEQLTWTTSWGSTTRLIGGLIMCHSDDNGLVLPPKLAPLHVVILPILNKPNFKGKIIEYCQQLQQAIQALQYNGQPIAVEIDLRELGGGEKAWSWVKKGVPLRIEVGPKELEAEKICLGRRDQPYQDRILINKQELLAELPNLLNNIQTVIHERALAFQRKNIHVIHNESDFYDFFNHQTGGVIAHWNGNPEIEKKIKEDLGVTIRCIPLKGKEELGACIFSGEKNSLKALFAKAY